jgi:hypothetical protein
MATTNPRCIIGLADSGDKVTLRHTNTGVEIDDVLIGTPLQ